MPQWPQDTSLRYKNQHSRLLLLYWLWVKELVVYPPVMSRQSISTIPLAKTHRSALHSSQGPKRLSLARKTRICMSNEPSTKAVLQQLTPSWSSLSIITTRLQTSSHRTSRWSRSETTISERTGSWNLSHTSDPSHHPYLTPIFYPLQSKSINIYHLGF